MGKRDAPSHVWLRQGALWSPLTCSQQQGASRVMLVQEAQVPVQKSELCIAGCSDSRGANNRRFLSKSCRWQPPWRISAFSIDLRLGSHVVSFSSPSSSSQEGEFPCQKRHRVIPSLVPPHEDVAWYHTEVWLLMGQNDNFYDSMKIKK